MCLRSPCYHLLQRKTVQVWRIYFMKPRATGRTAHVVSNHTFRVFQLIPTSFQWSMWLSSNRARQTRCSSASLCCECAVQLRALPSSLCIPMKKHNWWVLDFYFICISVHYCNHSRCKGSIEELIEALYLYFFFMFYHNFKSCMSLWYI